MKSIVYTDPVSAILNVILWFCLFIMITVIYRRREISNNAKVPTEKSQMNLIDTAIFSPLSNAIIIKIR